MSENLNNNQIAYCGLDCDECQAWFHEVRNKISELNNSLEKRNFKEISKAIPLMRWKYWGYRKFSNFFTGEECPNCREEGGNPFCKIRKCAKKKNYSNCAKCDEIYCKKFNSLLKIHNDGKIQQNMERILSKQ